jgi:S1-C subfamily serine protease
MKWTLTLMVFLLIGSRDASAARADSPADATVFVRLVGSVHAELEEVGTAPQTVDIDRVEIGTGSGFVISPHGYVLTNEHVIGNTQIIVNEPLRKARITVKVARIEVCFPEGSSSPRGSGPRCFDASVHSSDPALDLAVLFIGASDLPYVALGDSDVLRNGQGVSALGYPFGRALEVGRVSAPDLVPEVSTSQGSVSALRSDDSGVRSALQINGIVNPGNSGGPVLDERGYAVGVVRARVKGDAGIAFAIPINQAKDFLESRGLDSLMPVRRLRLGPVQTLERKGLALRVPEGMNVASPFRSHVESVPESTDFGLRIDRNVTPWTAAQLERALLQTESFERLSIEEHQSRNASQAGGAGSLLGRAFGRGADSGAAVAMEYAIVDLGDETIVARYVGSPEQLAYNESVLRGSLLSLDAQRLMSGEQVDVANIKWDAAGMPVSAGWILEPGITWRCAALRAPDGGVAAYPVGDVTLAVRRATWNDEAISTQQAAASCSSRRGPNGDSSYAVRTDWLGVSYAIEGAFVRFRSQLIQLEVISPVGKAALARALLAASIQKAAAAQ